MDTLFFYILTAERPDIYPVYNIIISSENEIKSQSELSSYLKS